MKEKEREREKQCAAEGQKEVTWRSMKKKRERKAMCCRGAKRGNMT